MAKPKTSAVAQAKASAAAKKAKAPGINKSVVLVLLAALVPFSLPTVVLVFFTMLPTLVAWVAEKGPHRYAYLCVGGLNFAGLFPYLFSLWFGVHTLDESFRMITDPMMLLITYCCAFIGWGLYSLIPPLVVTYLANHNRHRITNLRAAQAKLVTEWGDEVAKKAG